MNNSTRISNSKFRAIKVIKRDRTSLVPSVSEHASDRSISTTVDNWISERSKNRRAETDFSNDNIVKWKSRPL
jgi:hypothetical protein